MKKRYIKAVLRISRRLKHNKAGATAIEYGLLAALIAVTMMSGASCVGEALNAKFECTATAIATGEVSGIC